MADTEDSLSHFASKIEQLLPVYINEKHANCKDQILEELHMYQADSRFLLLKYTANWQQDDKAWTALHRAASNGDLDVIEKMVSGFSPEQKFEITKIQNRSGKTAIHKLVGKHLEDGLKLLLHGLLPEQRFDLFSIQDENGCAILHRVMSLHRDLLPKETVKFLLQCVGYEQRKMLLQMRDNAGNSPLHLAVNQDNEGAIQTILSSVNREDQQVLIMLQNNDSKYVMQDASPRALIAISYALLNKAIENTSDRLELLEASGAALETEWKEREEREEQQSDELRKQREELTKQHSEISQLQDACDTLKASETSLKQALEEVTTKISLLQASSNDPPQSWKSDQEKTTKDLAKQKKEICRQKKEIASIVERQTELDATNQTKETELGKLKDQLAMQKKELEETQKTCDELKAVNIQMNEEFTKTKPEIASLQRRVDQLASYEGQTLHEDANGELARLKKSFGHWQQECAQQSKELTESRREYNQLFHKFLELKKEKKEQDGEIAQGKKERKQLQETVSKLRDEKCQQNTDIKALKTEYDKMKELLEHIQIYIRTPVRTDADGDQEHEG